MTAHDKEVEGHAGMPCGGLYLAARGEKVEGCTGVEANASRLSANSANLSPSSPEGTARPATLARHTVRCAEHVRARVWNMWPRAQGAQGSPGAPRAPKDSPKGPRGPKGPWAPVGPGP